MNKKDLREKIEKYKVKSITKDVFGKPMEEQPISKIIVFRDEFELMDLMKEVCLEFLDNDHSVYTLCQDCHTWGVNMPENKLCGDCNSADTIEYYPDIKIKFNQLFKD